jgi:hypothetical protein
MGGFGDKGLFLLCGFLPINVINIILIYFKVMIYNAFNFNLQVGNKFAFISRNNKSP